MVYVTRSRPTVFRAMCAPAWAFPTPRNKSLEGKTMKSSSKFDIIVYGATGFTGQLVAESLAAGFTGNLGNQYPDLHSAGGTDPKWAMAGQSPTKLAAVRDAHAPPATSFLIE